MDRRHLVSSRLHAADGTGRGLPDSVPVGRGAIILLLLSWLAAPALAAAAPEEESPRFDPALIAAVTTIRDAFRSSQASVLATLLPEAGKVFLAVKVIAPDPSLYSRDQVEALLRQAFLTIQTLQFHINMDRSRGAGDANTLMLCPAEWSYRTGGARVNARLRFVLARRDERWTISEIRETR